MDRTAEEGMTVSFLRSRNYQFDIERIETKTNLIEVSSRVWRQLPQRVRLVMRDVVIDNVNLLSGSSFVPTFYHNKMCDCIAPGWIQADIEISVVVIGYHVPHEDRIRRKVLYIDVYFRPNSLKRPRHVLYLFCDCLPWNQSRAHGRSAGGHRLWHYHGFVHVKKVGAH